MPLFYHYTSDEGAERIIRTGKIMASLTFMASGDAVYGNGVYLTKLKPETSSKIQIARNNWMNASATFLIKTKNYFVLDIPDSKVQDLTDGGRNIFLFGNRNDLSLHKFHWWLKNFESGRIIASHAYHIDSYGPAYSMYSSLMGDYQMTDETVNGRPVYRGPQNHHLYMSYVGDWIVGQVAGHDQCILQQYSGYFSLGPDVAVPWLYSDPNLNYSNGWNKDDDTLKAQPWQV